MAEKKRVLIIGLDGFTWRLGRSMMIEGVMPNLKRLVEGGCHGKLRSVIPFETAPAWSSFQTGCYPGKTGVFAFHKYDRASRKVSVSSFADNAMPSLWELADRAGKKVVSLNMPVSFPSPKVDGVMIPGLLCPKLSRDTVWPPEAYDKYIKPRKDYVIINTDQRETVGEFVEQSVAAERVRSQVALELMADVDWDIFCVQIQSGDLMQHRLWWTLDPQAQGYCPERRSESLMFYRYIDGVIGQLVESAGKDVLKVIVSDHGFCGQKATVGINVWLRQHGYLTLLPREVNRKWVTIKQKVPLLKAMSRLYGNIEQGLFKWKYGRGKGDIPLSILVDMEHLRSLVDFDKTEAFCLGGSAGMLFINGDSARRTELAKKLSEELDREFGYGSQMPIILGIKSGKEVYGEVDRSDLLPDLVVRFYDGYVFLRQPLGDRVVMESDTSKQRGTHDQEGVVVINGAAVCDGKELNGDIVDIVPTVLSYLGVPVPLHMDGEPLLQAFRIPPEVIYEELSEKVLGKTEYSEDEQAQIEKRLADLGYL
ncbi:MAG: alkaline phosphatase family protein [Sedimentisphaerales bacterium]|nr:alkaline phosphatase family protein [Sedimentisphaerales bacterium]